MNVLPHMNLTLARLASEILEPLKYLIFPKLETFKISNPFFTQKKIYLLIFLGLFIASMMFSPRITPYITLLQFVGNWIQQTVK